MLLFIVWTGDDKDEQLNLEAVQRGDPEMEQKLNRLIRGCIERPGNLWIVAKTSNSNFNNIFQFLR